MPYVTTSSATVTVPPAAAAAAILNVVKEMGYEPTDGSPASDRELTFRAKRRFLRAELLGSVRIKENGAGSFLEVMIQTAPYETSGILDGRRNQKSVDELTARISSTLGTQSDR